VMLSPGALETKALLARSASIALSGALSDCYKAIEFAHGDIETPTEVYLGSADEKLESAMRALSEVDTMIRTAPVIAEALAWTQQLDFDRLYIDGVRDGLIPAHPVQWSRLVDINTSGKVLSISKVLLEDLSQIRSRIGEVLDLTINDTSRRNRAGIPFAVLGLQSVLLDAAAFAQMVAYVNTLEPLDAQWLKQEPMGRQAVELPV